MSKVQEIYKKHNHEISDVQLVEEILIFSELDIIDLWLLPEYAFNKWRQKHDYPRLLENIKKNQGDFLEWMKDQNIDDEDVLNGYLSDFFENKPKSKDKFRYLVKTSYKGEVSNQVWHEYNGVTSSPGDGESVIHEFKKKFISYYDWKLNKGERFSFTDTFHRYNPNTKHEEVYLNHNIRLLKMGGITPPTNSIGMLLRGKRLEFVNASGLNFSGTIYFGTMGNLSFNHSTVDNLKCNELKMPHLDFENCSVQNLQIRNSEIQQWNFITSHTNGNIVDSKVIHLKIFGGQFSPTFTNSEIIDVNVEHVGIVHDKEFDKTYRALAKSALEAGNGDLYKRLKTNELDFAREKSRKWKYFQLTLDRYYWGYGLKPYRLIPIALISILIFAFLYSLFPQNLGGLNSHCLSYVEVLLNTLYYSTVTFTILGYSDMNPTGFIKIIAATEALFGAFTMGFLIAGLTKNS